MPSTSQDRRVAFYVGGFEAVGGIEAFLFDLLTNMPADGVDRSMLVWAKDLPEFRIIERAGTKVFRTPLRSGCRFGLPDQLLFTRHGRRLRDVDRIVFAKIPPPPILARIERLARSHSPKPTEMVFVTPYRPREMWPDAMPDNIRRSFDRFLVQSSAFVDDLREMGFTGAIDILPYIPPSPAANPVDRARDGPFRLGFLGRFVPQKNLFYLLDLVNALGADALELHLFGGGDEDEALREKASRMGLPATFHGVVPREMVAEAIDSCDAFINPSISEGQCLVALEVLSRGRAFLASAVGAIPEILGKGRLGALVPLDDAVGAAAVLGDFVKEWRAGGWRAADIASDYASAYPRGEIISNYEKLL